MTFVLPTDTDAVWLGIGLLGQALFGARFLVQWIYSEIRGRSRVLPNSARTRGARADSWC